MRAGNKTAASRAAGIMSHYYVDICEPLHTVDHGMTGSMHTSYEQGADTLMRHASSHKNWVHNNGYTYVSNPARYTARTAYTTHFQAGSLISNFSGHGFNSRVREITALQLDRGANGLSNLLLSITENAATRATSPDVGGTVGVATNASSNFIIDSDRITRYNLKWHSQVATAGLAVGLDATITPRVVPGCVSGSRLYVPVNDSANPGNPRILIFDTATLQRLASVPTSTTSDIEALTIGANGFYALLAGDARRLYRLDGSTFRPTSSIRLSSPLPSGYNGLSYRKGNFYVSTKLYKGRDGLVRITSKGRVSTFFTSGLPGTHRGMSYRGKDLLWLLDAGAGNRRVKTLRFP